MTAPALLLVTVGAVCAPAFTSAAGAADPPEACALAKAAADAKRIEAAIDAYLDDASTCEGAGEELTRLNEQRLERDRKLAEGAREAKLAKAKGATDDERAVHDYLARQAFLDALAIDAGADDALAAIAALDQPPGTKNPFEIAQLLVDRGLEAEARTIVIEQLKKGNDIPADKYPDLEALVDEHYDASGPDQFRSDVDDVLDYAKWAIGVLITLAIVVVVGFVLLNYFWFDHLRRRDERVAPLPDDAPKRSRRWRAFTRPQLNVAPAEKDDKTALLLASRVRYAIGQLDRGRGAGEIRFATVPEAALGIGDLGDIDARVKPFVAALKLASRRDTVTAALSTGADDATHTRVAVEAFARKTPRRAAAIVGETKDGKLTPGLVGRTTAWTLFEAERMRPRLRDGGSVSAVYGTSHIWSYGCYLGALEAVRAGAIDDARQLLSESVAADPRFDRAVLNLAVVETFDDDPLVRGLGIRRLEALVEDMVIT